MGLIQELVDQLGVNKEQAEGGVGMLFNLAKDKLETSEFSQVSNVIPGLDGFINAAPAIEEGDSGGGGLLGAVRKVASTFGIGGGLGGLAGLASGFSKLDMDAGMITKFVPVVLGFVQNQGGDALKGILEKAFK